MSILAYTKKHSVITITIAIVVIAAMIIAGRLANKKSAAVATNDDKHVTMVPVESFRTDSSTVSADGIVESFSQADIKSQISSPVTSVRVAVGDNVYPGDILVELQNADIRAELDQANANLALVRGQYQTGDVSLGSTKQSAIDKAREGYQKADDAVFTDIESFLINSSGTNSTRLSTFSTDEKLRDKISTEYTDLKASIAILKDSTNRLSDESSESDILQNLGMTNKVLNNISIFLTDITQALNNAALITTGSDATLVSNWKAITTAARSSITSAIAGVSSAQATLSASISSHGTPAEAQVSVAEAGVKSLEAQLAKTIIRSPISGKISALPLREGELASPGQLIATVVGGGGLVIKAYTSSVDITRVNKGAAVSIGGKVSGVVEAVAPSVNQTNKKVEVRIIVTDPDASGLVVGQSVQTLITAPRSVVDTNALYLLPIQDVKIVPGNAYVFTVDANSKIEKKEVLLGDIKGDFIEIKSGLTDDMKIATPVYELNEGDTVKTE